MSRLTLTFDDAWDDQTKSFVPAFSIDVEVQHSLLAVSKWESLHNKPFLSQDPKTPDELVSYVGCMIDADIPVDTLARLTDESLASIKKLIESSHTASSVVTPSGRVGGEIVTSELIYFWMTQLSIPFETERWHLNRLLTLIRVANAKLNPKKMAKKDIYEQNRRLNQQRRARLNSNG